MRYKKNLDEVIDRNRRFWNRQATGRILAKIDSIHDRSLPLATMFEAPTVALFADVIRNAKSPEHWPTAVAMQRQGRLPPLFESEARAGALRDETRTSSVTLLLRSGR